MVFFSNAAQLLRGPVRLGRWLQTIQVKHCSLGRTHGRISAVPSTSWRLTRKEPGRPRSAGGALRACGVRLLCRASLFRKIQSDMARQQPNAHTPSSSCSARILVLHAHRRQVRRPLMIATGLR